MPCADNLRIFSFVATFVLRLVERFLTRASLRQSVSQAFLVLLASVTVVVMATGVSLRQGQSTNAANSQPGLSYTNCCVANVPWSIHVVELARPSPLYEVLSVHAGGKAIGLETVSEQLGELNTAQGLPIAAINGDFYQRDRAYAGAPRGLQIANGELISAPSGGACFWVDASYQPHTANVASLFRVIWPKGATTAFGLNAERRAEGIELYTSAIGASTHTVGGRELTLERTEGSRWLPLRIGQAYLARVREVRETGNTPLAADIMVLSVAPAALNRLPAVRTGDVLQISTGSAPALHGVRTAIGGGPVLLRGGKPQKISASTSEAYEFSSMLERHPRTAIGWSPQHLFLVVVDGRQKHLSVGMTLDELTTCLVGLGCTDAMNLDGGGSATLWYDGQVKNSPCDRVEREVANSLVLLKKRGAGVMPDTAITH